MVLGCAEGSEDMVLVCVEGPEDKIDLRAGSTEDSSELSPYCTTPSCSSAAAGDDCHVFASDDLDFGLAPKC